MTIRGSIGVCIGLETYDGTQSYQSLVVLCSIGRQLWGEVAPGAWTTSSDLLTFREALQANHPLTFLPLYSKKCHLRAL